jgi:septal ring-binding cell division protein DamX
MPKWYGLQGLIIIIIISACSCKRSKQTKHQCMAEKNSTEGCESNAPHFSGRRLTTKTQRMQARSLPAYSGIESSQHQALKHVSSRSTHDELAAADAHGKEPHTTPAIQRHVTLASATRYMPVPYLILHLLHRHIH